MKKQQNQTRGLHGIKFGAGAVMLTTLFAVPTYAQTTEGATLKASDPANDDQAGNAVDISGNTVIVGAYREGTSPGEPTDAGAAYIFVDTGSAWVQEDKLLPPSRNANDWFGSSVAIDGDVAVVGAPFDTVAPFSSGAVYVFRRNAGVWGSPVTLVATSRGNGDRFGSAVDIQGNRIVVGADEFFTGGTGKAHVFEFDGSAWIQTASLHVFAPGLDPGDKFGTSIALDGDSVIVGAIGDDGATDATPDSGAAYVFTVTSGVSQQAVLRASDAFNNDQFGFAASVSGNTAAVGSRLDEPNAFPNDDFGSVYVFDRSGLSWNQTVKLVSAETDVNDALGSSVAVDGDHLVAGAPNGFGGAGYVAVFRRAAGVWTDHTDIFPAVPGWAGQFDVFGTSVALEGTTFVGGAPGNDDINPLDGQRPQSGNATLFQIDPAPPSGDTDGDGLSDADEIFLGGGPGVCPDPNNPDSDGDGIDDGDENDFGPNTCDPDTDDDGLNDGDEVNDHGTDPTVADSDGDGLSDGAEVNTHNTDPLDTDSDDDTLLDGDEIGLGTNPNASDTDGDGLSDAVEAPAGCPHPTVADSDGDGLNDGMETAAGWDPCDQDTDGDTLSDGAEVNTHNTDPNDPDSDDDNLSDGAEIGMGGSAGVCPDPNDPDSDNDGVLDGNEMVGTCGPCDADSDNDGLCNSAEATEGTNPADPDSDDDGLLDGAEVATNCTDPLDADSDGDTLSDGAETTAGTNPCSADSDGDTLPDNIDPQPTIPNVTPTVLASLTLATAGGVFDTSVSAFVGPNNSVRQARRAILTAQLALAAIAINNGNYNAARALLILSDVRVDGSSLPADWMVAGSARSQIHTDIQTLLVLLDLID